MDVYTPQGRTFKNEKHTLWVESCPFFLFFVLRGGVLVMSGGKPPYFIDKKGEVNELRALLRNHSLMRVATKKRDIIKKVD